MSLLPDSRPKLPENRVREILAQHGIPTATEPVAILGVRGYYRDTFGKHGVNDVGTYDDAMFLISPQPMIALNANTDPSRLGWNSGVGKPFAVLQPGLWYFRRGPHKAHPRALRQCTDEEAHNIGIPNEGHFKVERSYGAGDKRNFFESEYFAINIHPGGENTTSSWGCQTVPPSQFKQFIERVWGESIHARQNKIPYLLVEGPLI
ncbi:MAG: hypothetical protein EBR82_19170 [Caulobacteraceae bacterium]|nr:hypothetical protein [Caulobacteraceae bacterium]